jgi:hypothetical protein
MFKHRGAPLLALLIAFFAQTAHAFLNAPYITPAAPTAGQTISVNIYGGVCDAIVSVPGYPQVTQNGNAIRILLFSVHYSDSEFCNLGIGTAVEAVGAYPPGSYTLQVDRRYSNFAGDYVVETLGIISFTITGQAAPPVSAPTLNGTGLLILVLALMGFAAWGVRAGRAGLLLVVVLGLPLGARAQTTQPSDRIIEVLVSTAAGAIAAQDEGKPKAVTEPTAQKIEWLGVEVITDKPKLVADVRSKIPLSPHTKLDFPGDVRYKQWCDAVRAAYPAAVTSCSPILMDGAKGYYVVQVEFTPRQFGKKTCDPRAPKLPQTLRVLSDQFMDLLQASLMKNTQEGAPYREFVNDEGVLDYADTALHEFSRSAHTAVRAHLQDVIASTKTCDAGDRSAAIQLMNWSGDIATSIRVGSDGILDEDGGVRNSSTRLIGVFMGSLDDSVSISPLVHALCTLLDYTSFTDRDKAINALLALADQRPASRHAIRDSCGPLIRQRAFNGESTSPQIQGSATNLLTLLGRNLRR